MGQRWAAAGRGWAAAGHPPSPARQRLTCRGVRDDGDEQALAPRPHALVWVLHAQDHPLHLGEGTPGGAAPDGLPRPRPDSPQRDRGAQGRLPRHGGFGAAAGSGGRGEGRGTGPRPPRPLPRLDAPPRRTRRRDPGPASTLVRARTTPVPPLPAPHAGKPRGRGAGLRPGTHLAEMRQLRTPPSAGHGCRAPDGGAVEPPPPARPYAPPLPRPHRPAAAPPLAAAPPPAPRARWAPPPPTLGGLSLRARSAWLWGLGGSPPAPSGDTEARVRGRGPPRMLRAL